MGTHSIITTSLRFCEASQHGDTTCSTPLGSARVWHCSALASSSGFLKTHEAFCQAAGLMSGIFVCASGMYSCTQCECPIIVLDLQSSLSILLLQQRAPAANILPDCLPADGCKNQQCKLPNQVEVCDYSLSTESLLNMLS